MFFHQETYLRGRLFLLQSYILRPLLWILSYFTLSIMLNNLKVWNTSHGYTTIIISISNPRPSSKLSSVYSRFWGHSWNSVSCNNSNYHLFVQTFWVPFFFLVSLLVVCCLVFVGLRGTPTNTMRTTWILFLVLTCISKLFSQYL